MSQKAGILVATDFAEKKYTKTVTQRKQYK
jgi:hypothetical protein